MKIMTDKEFDEIMEEIYSEAKKRAARPKSCLKTYVYASPNSKPYGALPNYPQRSIVGEPTINNYWYNTENLSCTSSFGVGDCMICFYIPNALKDMADGIQMFLDRWEQR